MIVAWISEVLDSSLAAEAGQCSIRKEFSTERKERLDAYHRKRQVLSVPTSRNAPCDEIQP